MRDFTEAHAGHPDRGIYTSRRRQRRVRRARARTQLAIVGLAVVTGALALYWYGPWAEGRLGPELSTIARNPAAATDPPAPAATPPIDLPELDASDALVRSLARGISAHPRIASLLATDGLIRRVVASVAAASRGMSSAAQLDVVKPAEGFTVVESGGRTRVDPAGYRRYDALAAAFGSLDPQGVAETYRRLQPLFEEAYAELGLGKGTFDDALARTFGGYLAVEVPADPPALVTDGALYAFADPALEASSPVAKQLMRMGPDNAHRVQAAMQELARAMGIEPRDPGS
jgi:hypothetical protein